MLPILERYILAVGPLKSALPLPTSLLLLLLLQHSLSFPFHFCLSTDFIQLHVPLPCYPLPSPSHPRHPSGIILTVSGVFLCTCESILIRADIVFAGTNCLV